MSLYAYDENEGIVPPAPSAAAAQPPPGAAPAPQPAAEAKPADAAAPPADEGYSLKHAIVDALAHRFGFGTPLRNVEQMKTAQQTSQKQLEREAFILDQAKLKAKQTNAIQHMAPFMKSIAKDTSPYFGDLKHLAEGINGSEDTMAVVGGRVDARPTGEKGKDGLEMYDWMTIDPQTGQTLSTVRVSPRELLDRFYASQAPDTQRELLKGIEESDLKDRRKAEKFMELADADPLTKMANQVALTPMEKYLYLKSINDRVPGDAKLHDWQLMEQAGIKQDPEWKHVGQLVRMEDGTYASIQEHKRTGAIRQTKIPGSSWKALGEKAEKIGSQWKALWVDTDDDTGAVKRAKGLFGAEVELARTKKDPNLYFDLIGRVLPEYRTWVETLGDEEQPTTSDLHAKLREIVKAGSAAEEDDEDGAPAKGNEDDAGDWRRYHNQQQQSRAKGWKKHQAEKEAEKNKPATSALDLRPPAAPSVRAAAMTQYPANWMTGRDD